MTRIYFYTQKVPFAKDYKRKIYSNNSMEQLNAYHIDLDRPEFKPLIKKIKDKSLVLIGESSHGTHEFYKLRAELTKKLIADHGFTAVAIEGDWPDTYRVNRYVKGLSKDESKTCLDDYSRFPLWMWRNEVVLDFISWLRQHNEGRTRKAGFFGLDLYGLNNSIHNIIETLERIDPKAAHKARERYSCLEFPLENGQTYGARVFQGSIEHCKEEVLEQLKAIRKDNKHREIDPKDEDAKLNLELSALGVVSAEAYYRQLFDSSVSTWNIRDGHMMKCLNVLKKNEEKKGGAGKIIVWAHNSHVGDASSKHRAQNEEITLGEIVKQQYPEDSFLIGMTTYEGSVTAADKWGEEAEFFRVNPALEDSHAAYLKKTKRGNYMLDPKENPSLNVTRLERAIGVIYRPATERYSHYFHSNLAQRFDWIIHVENTNALKPLDGVDRWKPSKGLMETYPSGL